MTINTSRRKMRDVARNIHQCTPLRRILVFILLCFVLIVACAFRAASLPIILTKADDGKTVTASSGNRIIIQLPDNSGSTGYTWNFTTSSNQVLTWQNTTYLPPRSLPMLGAPGIVAFTFLTHDSGNVHIQFALRRNWEVNVPPIQRFTVTVHVQH